MIKDIRNEKFKAGIKSWISFEKRVHRVIKFNQNAWLKPYIRMKTDLRKKANDFEKSFFYVNE